VVGALDSLTAEGEGEEAGDVGEERTGGVATETLELVARVDGVGDDDAVGGLDGTAWLAEVLHRLAGVQAVVIEALGAQHLDVVELHEQQKEQDEAGDPEPADLTVHAAETASTTTVVRLVVSLSDTRSNRANR